MKIFLTLLFVNLSLIDIINGQPLSFNDYMHLYEFNNYENNKERIIKNRIKDCKIIDYSYPKIILSPIEQGYFTYDSLIISKMSQIKNIDSIEFILKSKNWTYHRCEITKFDKKGNILETSFNYESNVGSWKMIYNYDKKGRLETRQDIDWKNDYFYDNKNNINMFISTNNDRKLDKDTTFCEYDKNGNLIKISYGHNKENNPPPDFIFEYNENKKLIKQTQTDWSTMFLYVNNNLTEENYYYKNQIRQSFKYYYNDSGKVINKEHSYNGDSIGNTKYKYDSNNNLIYEITYSDSTITFMKFITYDLKGNKSKEIKCSLEKANGFIGPDWYEIEKKEYYYEYWN